MTPARTLRMFGNLSGSRLGSDPAFDGTLTLNRTGHRLEKQECGGMGVAVEFRGRCTAETPFKNTILQ